MSYNLRFKKSSHSNCKNMEQSIKTLSDSVKEMRNDVNEVLTSIKSVNTTNERIEKRIESMTTMYEALEAKVNTACEQYNTLFLKQRQLEERIIAVETYSRRDNLLINGIPESTTESQGDCLNLVRKLFEETMGINHAVQMEIASCHRLGRPPSSSSAGTQSQNRPRTVIVRFKYYEDRQHVWQAKKTLKDSGYFINEDFPTEIIERRKTLIPIMQKAKKLGHTSFLVKDKLHIHFSDNDKKVYDVSTLSTLPPTLDPKYVTTQQSDTVFAFFGSLCPLSNFHPSPFNVEGRMFRWVEEYFVHKKAQLANDELAVQKIIQANSPLECKTIGKAIRVDKGKWQQLENDVMKKALQQKFLQNPDLKEYLLQTGDKTIAEASPVDRYWGTGVELRKEETTKGPWPGKNTLGNLLMTLRTELK